MKRVKITLLIGAIFLLNLLSVRADIDEKQLSKQLPMLLGSSNAGTEFFMAFHPCWETNGKKDGLKVYVTSAVATKVTVSIEANDLIMQKTTVPNGIIEFHLPPAMGQCYTKTDRIEPQPQRVFKGKGIIVSAADPIVVYGVTRFQYTSDGYLAIPKSGLGRSYIASSWNDPSPDNGTQFLTSYTSIVAAYNKTDVKIILGGEFGNYTPGKDGLVTGDSFKRRMNKGDVWLIGVMGDYNDLSGTTVNANKPVAVISGSFCAYIPIQKSACDFNIEQDIPMESWGTKYHVTPVSERKNASFIKVYTSVNNTIIKRDGQEWAKIQESGGVIDKGYLTRRPYSTDATATGGGGLGYVPPAVISSDQRISVTQYNCGQNDDGVDSDPFQMVLTPIEQYQDKIIWCTPGVNGGSFFKVNYVNLCYKTDQGQIPLDMEFGQVRNGTVSWRKLATVVPTPGLPLNDPEVTDGNTWNALTIKLEDPAGVYALRGEGKFAAYGYGFDNYDSYGFPVSAAFKDLSKPDIWAAHFEYSQDCYGYCEGTATEQPQNDESLRSNFGYVGYDKNETYNYKFTYDEEGFFPGETYMMDWQLEVENSDADAQAVLIFNDRAGNDTTVTIEYHRTKFSIRKAITNWDQKAYNDPKESKELTLINQSAAAVTVDSIVMLSSNIDRDWEYNGFYVDDAIYTNGTLPKVVAPGEEIKFNVIFDPASVKTEIQGGKSNFMDSIGVKAYWSNDVNEYCYFKYRAVVKSSAGSPCINVGNLTFPPTTVDVTAVKDTIIANHGSSPLTITGYEYTGSAIVDIYNVVVSGNTVDVEAISVNNPLIIDANGVETVEIHFTPTDSIEYTGSIIFTSDADPSKSVCDTLDNVLEIIGWGKKPGIFLTGYIWSPQRTHLPIYNNDDNPYKTNGMIKYPYTTDDGNGVTGMKIGNSGGEPFKITDVRIVAETQDHAEYFYMTLNELSIAPDGTLEDVIADVDGITVQNGDAGIRVFPVFYNPLTPGNHKIKIIVEGETNGYLVTDSCEFHGTSIHPKAETFDYIFTEFEQGAENTAIVGEKGAFKADITITNTDWESSDVLTIYDVKLKDAEGNAISKDITVKGGDFYNFDYNGIVFPVTVKVGESFSFEAFYYADKSSPKYGTEAFIAHIDFETDADLQDYESKWTAKSITQGAGTTNETAQTCMTHPVDYTVSITNVADDQLEISNVEIIDNAGHGTFTYSGPTTDIVIPRGGSMDFPIYCLNDFPSPVGQPYQAQLAYTTNIVNPDSTIKYSELELEVFGYPRQFTGLINNKAYTGNDFFQIGYEKSGVNNDFVYSVIVESSDEDMVHVVDSTDFYITIKYNPNYLGAEVVNNDEIKVTLGSGLDGSNYSISATEREWNKDIDLMEDSIYVFIDVKITNDNSKPITTKNAFELVKLNFRVFQNENSVESSVNDISFLIPEVITNEACIDLTLNTYPGVQLKEVCAQNTRLVQYGNTPSEIFSMGDVPYPVKSNGFALNYSLGFECNTSVQIYDLSGKLVKTVINEIQNSGQHNTHINVNNLSSGTYMIKVTAGPFTEIKEVIINK